MKEMINSNVISESVTESIKAAAMVILLKNSVRGWDGFPEWR